MREGGGHGVVRVMGTGSRNRGDLGVLNYSIICACAVCKRLQPAAFWRSRDSRRLKQFQGMDHCGRAQCHACLGHEEHAAEAEAKQNIPGAM